MNPVDVKQGSSPLVLAFPHTGLGIPSDILDSLNERGHGMSDTDWHVHDLYDGLVEDATTVRALFHRYVIDANRPGDGASLYPGQNTTGLCPVTDFDGNPLYRTGREPDEGEIDSRRALFHSAYHDALQAELDRVRDLHGFVVLYDCHSIRSQVPYLFQGRLPDFNIGTNSGKSCDAVMERAVVASCEEAVGFTSVLNGRFKGGWTTRHYGRPDLHQHAIQMELSQIRYMDEMPPWSYRRDLAETLRPHLQRVLLALLAAAQDHYQSSKEPSR